jgi:hypothetical protein
MEYSSTGRGPSFFICRLIWFQPPPLSLSLSSLCVASKKMFASDRNQGGEGGGGAKLDDSKLYFKVSSVCMQLLSYVHQNLKV